MRLYLSLFTLGILCATTQTQANEDHEQPKFIEPASIESSNFSEPCPPFKDDRGLYIVAANPHDRPEYLQFTCNTLTYISQPLFWCKSGERATLENTTLQGIQLFFWQRQANGSWRGYLRPSLTQVRLFGHCRQLPPQ